MNLLYGAIFPCPREWGDGSWLERIMNISLILFMSELLQTNAWKHSDSKEFASSKIMLTWPQVGSLILRMRIPKTTLGIQYVIARDADSSPFQQIAACRYILIFHLSTSFP